ncbi:MAG: glycosyltransferase [Lachnospiraceae bacterium]|nr:glycosyltransferase [Lachnospiraceae bacterium]
MIRVLQIGLGPNPGGIESCIVNYHRHLDRQAVQFDYADIYGRGLAFADDIAAMGGKIHTLPDYKKDPRGMARGLAGVLEREDYDIIHINMLSAANMIPVNTAVKVGKGTVIVHSHNTAVPSGVLRRVLNTLNMKKLRSLPVKKWACGREAGLWMWGESFDPENVLPNALDMAAFAPDAEVRQAKRRELGIGDDEYVIGTVGRLSEQKNSLFLPDIAAAVKKAGVKARWLIIGGGELETALKEKIKSLGLEETVLPVGVQNPVSPWYKAMDAFVLPSLFEGLPIVALEAQAAGLSTLISENVTREAALTDGVRYLPIDRGPDPWAEALAQLAAEHEACRKSGEAARVAAEHETRQGALMSDDDGHLTDKTIENEAPAFPAAYRFPEAAAILTEKYRRLL